MSVLLVSSQNFLTGKVVDGLVFVQFLSLATDKDTKLGERAERGRNPIRPFPVTFILEIWPKKGLFNFKESQDSS